MAYVYIIKNTINDKVYIGTTTQKVRTRYCQHFKDSSLYGKNMRKHKIYQAIREFGKDKFYYEILEEVPKEIMFDKEVEYIEKYNSYENGYNNTRGGKGGITVSDKIAPKLFEDYLKYHSVDKVAKLNGLKQYEAIRVLHRNNYHIECLEEKRSIKNDDIDKFIELFNEGVTYQKMANFFKCDIKTITRQARKLNLWRKKRTNNI